MSVEQRITSFGNPKHYFYERTSLHLEGKGDKIEGLVFSLKLLCKTGMLEKIKQTIHLLGQMSLGWKGEAPNKIFDTCHFSVAFQTLSLFFLAPALFSKKDLPFLNLS